MARAEELRTLTQILSDQRIAYIALKGPALAQVVYGSVAARSSCDLDILVRPESIPIADRLLQELGYVVEPEDTSQSGRYHVAYGHPKKTTLELHWRLNSQRERAPIEQTGIWNRTRGVWLGSLEIRTLGLEDTLLHSCVHGYKHRWTRLKWSADIAYLVRRAKGLDWDAVVARADIAGCRRMLLVGVNLARMLFDVSAPAEIVRLISRDNPAEIVSKQVCNALLERRLLNPREDLLFDLRGRERVGDHAILFAQTLQRIFRFTNQDERSFWLARAFRRPVRLYRTYGVSWVKPWLRMS
jgi:hypothetical protein